MVEGVNIQTNSLENTCVKWALSVLTNSSARNRSALRSALWNKKIERQCYLSKYMGNHIVTGDFGTVKSDSSGHFTLEFTVMLALFNIVYVPI